MSYETSELDFPIREYSSALDANLGEFLGSSAERGDIDPVNAGRLLALGDLGRTVTYATLEQIREISGGGDGELKPDHIIAPALRVRGDFMEVDEVYAQADEGSPWLLRDVFCVDEGAPSESAILLGHPIVLHSKDLIGLVANPKSPRLFSAEDYETAMPPLFGRRRSRSGNQPRWAILLSHFHEEITESTPRNTLRHFQLQLNDTYPRPNSRGET